MKDRIIHRPICLLGTGRSGTTLFFQLLTGHPSLAWFSNYTSKFPRLPYLAAFSRILDMPGIGPLVRPEWRLSPKPMEAVPLYRYLTDGMFDAPRPLTSADATPEVIERYRRYVRIHLSYQGKERFVQKHTGFPRMQYLSAILPDACFINVVRDGRAVVNSMLNVRWWDGLDSWLWGPMDACYEEEYLAADREPAVLAAIVWKTLMDFLAEARKEIPSDRYREVRYDHLVKDPRGVMHDVLSFCDLSPSDAFAERVAAVQVRDGDEKWKQALTPRQIALVEKCLATQLERYEYSRQESRYSS